jgi:hypothetical protein
MRHNKKPPSYTLHSSTSKQKFTSDVRNCKLSRVRKRSDVTEHAAIERPEVIRVLPEKNCRLWEIRTNMNALCILVYEGKECSIYKWDILSNNYYG